MHVDGDSFFASCEVAKDPSLRGKPVITGRERGIVSSMSYEAKRLGVKRAMPLHEIAKRFPQAVILPSDYETYSIVSQRMYEIVRRYTPAVEEYSIDECFADLTGMRRVHGMGYPDIVAAIKRDMERELGMTFSVGLSCTKSLAKIGSKWKKPDGLTVLRLPEVPVFLRQTPIGKIWGIGPNTAAHLEKLGIRSAYDFTRKSEEWVRSHTSKPYQDIWHELQGTVTNELDVEGRETYQSISKTKTFTPPSRDPAFLFAELSKNIENACIKARRWGLATKEVFFFLKTQEFKYYGCEVKLSHPTAIPQEILAEVERYFPQVFRRGVAYRATGITLMKLSDARTVQLDLFGSVLKSEGLKRVFESVDDMSARYGKHIVFLASSLKTMERRIREGERGGPSTTTGPRFRGETMRRRLGLTYLGETT
jgi:DNA polymerase-4/DNA polymerase V